MLWFCKLRQPCLCASRHPGHERFSDRNEAFESSAEAIQERQQALLSLVWEVNAVTLALLGHLHAR